MNIYPTTYLPQRAQRNFIDLNINKQQPSNNSHTSSSSARSSASPLGNFASAAIHSPSVPEDTSELITRFPFLLPVLDTVTSPSPSPSPSPSSTTAVSSSEEELAQAMLKQIDHFSSVLDDLEAKRERSDNVEGLRVLQKKVTGSSKLNFLKPGRKLLNQGKVLVVDSSRTKPKERQLVLLSDLLLVLKEKKRVVVSKKNLSIVKAIPLKDATLNDISIVGQEHSFMVYTPDRVGIFSTTSKYDKFNWMRLIQECINGSYNKIKTNHLTSTSTSPSSSTTIPSINNISNIGDDNTDELECLEDFSSSTSSQSTLTPRGEKEEEEEATGGELLSKKSFAAPENTIEVTIITT